MKLFRKLVCILLLVFVLGAASVCAESALPERTRSTGSPYYLMVNRQTNTLTVYALGENGTYSVPLRAMICSTGRKGHATPLGTFTLSSYKSLWTHMVDGSYGQYVSQFKGDYLFHSVCYREKDPSTLMTEEYNMLGSVASRGCVRLQVVDAKWVFDNCPAGTKVTIYDSPDPGPLGKPTRMVDFISEEQDNGWDPTDPRSENPWHEHLAQTLGLLEPTLVAEAEGQASYATGAPSEENADAAVAEPFSVVAVSIPQVRAEETETEFSAREEETAAPEDCAALSDAALPPLFDVQPEQWYYADIRYLYEKRLYTAAWGAEDPFAPEACVTAAMALETLCRLAGEDPDGRRVLTWARELGADQMLSADALKPEHTLTRQEFAQLLYCFETTYRTHEQNRPVSLREFADSAQVLPEAADAVAWAVERGLLRGAADQMLLPGALLTRAQFAAILHRYALLASVVA